MVTNPSADTLYLQSTLPFGTAFASETTGSSNRLFTSYDRSPSAGLDYAVNRTYSPGQGRFTQVDPIGMASTSLGNPQSLNLYAYVQNKPTDFADPLGLHEPCIHEAMTKFLGQLAGLDSGVVDKLALFAGDRDKNSADAPKFAATSAVNVGQCLAMGVGPNVRLHFPNATQLAENKKQYPEYMGVGDYMGGGHVLHSVQDSGAHAGFSNAVCLGHATSAVAGITPWGPILVDPHLVDRKIGDSNFIRAANETFGLMKNDPSLTLTSQQITDLIAAIVSACGDKFPLNVVHPALAISGGGVGGTIADAGHSNGDLQIWTGIGGSAIDWLTWEYSNRPPTIAY